MQRGLFAQPSIEQQIKDVFYNALINYVFDHGDFTRENLGQKLADGTAAIIRQILESSKKCPGIRLPTGKVIKPEECPDRYKPLFEMLNRLKDQAVNDKALAIVAGKIMALDSFREMNPTQFLLEASGQAAPVINDIRYDETGITPELIRSTFYNEMINQAMLATQEEWLLLSVDDLVDQEGHIYWALPALTILEAIQQSQQCNGIRLLNDKVVNNQNCPQVENFPDLVRNILAVKAKVKSLSEDELRFIKHKVACEKDLPEHLQQLPNQQSLQDIVNVIKGMAIEISRKRVFCQMVGLVVNTCVEILKPASPRM